MSGSGLIYAAIALMWAAVLIPMWLRNHDSAVENRSAEKFGQAMRVLSRKERDDAEESPQSHAEFDTSDRPETVVAPAVERHTKRVSERTSAPARRRRPEPRPRPQRTLAQRRARTLTGLAAVLVVLTLAAVATPVPWWAPLSVVALLVAFVVHLRVQAIQREHRRTGARRPAPRRVEGAEPALPSTQSAQQETVSGAAPAEERRASSFVSGPSRAVVVETKGATSDVPVASDEDDTWRPNPLPLPTYVTAPKAVRPIKVIDLTTPGAWTSGRLLDDDFATEDLLAAEIASDELDALLEHEAAPKPAEQENDDASRRAVGD